ncbi:MAG: hypothetical protein ACN6NT_08455, partial [Comamonas sp.]
SCGCTNARRAQELCGAAIYGEKLVGEESPAQIALSPQACHALREGAVIVYVPVCLAVAMGVQCA